MPFPYFHLGKDVAVGVFWWYDNIGITFDVTAKVFSLRRCPCGLLIYDWRDANHIFPAVFTLVVSFLQPLAEGCQHLSLGKHLQFIIERCLASV